MKRSTLLATIFVAVGILVAGARPSAAQGPYYPPPAWDQKLPASTRFVRVFFAEVCANNLCAQVAQAVLDRETGLVWERSPSSDLFDLLSAAFSCNQKRRANRLGWRLPSVDELSSLIEQTPNSSGATLPPGHPFFNVASGSYWANSAAPPSDSSLGPLFFVVSFSPFMVDSPVAFASPEIQAFAWCVRGGAK